MKVLFDLIPKKQEEMVLFQVHEKVPFLTSIADILEKYKVETILVRDYKKERDVYLDLFSIFYIEYLDRKCFFYTENEVYERRLTLAQLMKELPEQFIQISKTTILNIYMVKEINSSLLNGNLYITLQNTEELLVSRYFSKALKEKIDQTFRNK